MASTASQKAPAPRPSWTREPVSRSKVATALAGTAGGRGGGELTAGTMVTCRVRAAPAAVAGSGKGNGPAVASEAVPSRPVGSQGDGGSGTGTRVRELFSAAGRG